MRKPRVFIGSSTESLASAEAIQENLEHATIPVVWTQGIFDVSTYTLESLLNTLGDTDFAIFVFAPDDVVLIRDVVNSVVRDNVLYELGLFTGHLGRNRTFIVMPRGVKDFRLPTDLLGITTVTYDPVRLDKNPVAALGTACTKIKRAIQKAQAESPEHEQTLLLGCYDGPRDHYQVGVQMLSRPCARMFLLQHSSSLILGSEGGCSIEKRFNQLLHQRIREGAEFLHVTSIASISNHLSSPSRNYPHIREALEALDHRSEYARVVAQDDIWPIRIIPDTISAGGSFSKQPGPAFLTQYPEGRTDSLFIANIGTSQTCFHMCGPKMNIFFRQYENFYHDCHVLRWKQLEAVLKDYIE